MCEYHQKFVRLRITYQFSLFNETNTAITFFVWVKIRDLPRILQRAVASGLVSL